MTSAKPQKNKWCKVRNRNEFLHKAAILEVAQSPRTDLLLKRSILKTPFTALSKTWYVTCSGNSLYISMSTYPCQLPLHIRFSRLQTFAQRERRGDSISNPWSQPHAPGSEHRTSWFSLTAYLTKTVVKQHSHKCCLLWCKSHKNLEFLLKDNMNDHVQDNSE